MFLFFNVHVESTMDKNTPNTWSQSHPRSVPLSFYSLMLLLIVDQMNYRYRVEDKVPNIACILFRL